LTSYPARFETLHLALSCLLDQSVKADRTILWVAHKDEDHLPPQFGSSHNAGWKSGRAMICAHSAATPSF
jgi:hypothetical protein